MNKLSIIVPTYKEALNIAPLTEKIHQVLNDQTYGYEIIIVDDNSNDGTEEAAAKLAGTYPVTLHVRKDERGLASAVIKGFEFASGNVIAVMDGDLSHPPEKIPELVSHIFEGKSEFSMGSRFVAGGNADHFNLFRKLNAGVSRLMARPFTRVSDPMAGFFAFPSSLLEKAAPLDPIGFKIGLELIVKAAPATCIDIPIHFSERLHGESKLSLKEQVNYLRHLVKLFRFKFEALYQFILFCVVGTSGMAVDLTTLFIARESAGLPFRYARVIGVIAAMTTNFFLNRKYTFSEGRDRGASAQYVLFLLVSAVGFSVNWLISVFLVENTVFFASGYFYLLASVIGILGGTIINFAGSRYIVFKK